MYPWVLRLQLPCAHYGRSRFFAQFVGLLLYFGCRRAHLPSHPPTHFESRYRLLGAAIFADPPLGLGWRRSQFYHCDRLRGMRLPRVETVGAQRHTATTGAPDAFLEAGSHPCRGIRRHEEDIRWPQALVG